MYIVEISLKMTPMPFSVQRKAMEDAQSVYDRLLEAMQSGTPALLELTCEHQAEKKLTLRTSEITAVQVYEKSGSAMTGKRPGFAFAE
ncbi:MAG: hypothetical protein ACO31I_07610 [Prochlorotrichaceae cyanobacterium]|jgi:hypothetical protein